jgi:uncharacterized membrane protein YbjE (DUF340 family)
MWWFVLTFVIGLAVGRKRLLPAAIIFAILLLAVGYSLGQDGTLWPRIKSEGLRMMAIPASVLIGTLAGGLLAAFVLQAGLRIVIATSAGRFSSHCFSEDGGRLCFS